MDNEILALIKQATSEHKVCHAYFEKDPGARTIHPYGLFRTAQDKTMIACYQVGGYSSSGKLPEFRNFAIEKCKKIEILDKKFHVTESFNPSAPIYHWWIYHI